MIHGKTDYSKAHIWAGVLLILMFTLSTAVPATAQATLSNLRLLAWSPDGLFLLGAAPGRVATLPDGSLRQTQTLWLLPVDGSEGRRLAEGLDPQLSPTDQQVIFTRLDVHSRPGLWAIDMKTGRLQPPARQSNPCQYETPG